eukprot:127017_1
MTQSQINWTKNTNPSFSSSVSHIFKLNETELLILVGWHTFDSLWTYNILNKNYTKMFDVLALFEIELDEVYNYTASLDNKKLLLYLFGENGKIVKINLRTEQIELSSQIYHDGSCSKSLFINNQFHIFGGWDKKDKSHFIWNENKQHLVGICKFEQIENTLYAHSIQYSKSKNSILIIQYMSKQIYLYSLSTNKITQFPMNLPH